ncbi:MAG: hypothetical protein NZ533_05385 [Casimicrobiaceae bacterium]|nr:hypothetical protein [Casimicrobiaceae bacterium]
MMLSYHPHRETLELRHLRTDCLRMACAVHGLACHGKRLVSSGLLIGAMGLLGCGTVQPGAAARGPTVESPKTHSSVEVRHEFPTALLVPMSERVSVTATPSSLSATAAGPAAPPEHAPVTAVTTPEVQPGTPSTAINARTPAEIATTSAPTPQGQPRYHCQRGAVVTPIELPTGSERLCSRHPAMGPCQYEREQCRRRGGRVMRFDGVEITAEVEREYDKQVTRIRLRAD